MPKKCFFCGREEVPDDWMPYYDILGKDACHQCVSNNKVELIKTVAKAMVEDEKKK